MRKLFLTLFAALTAACSLYAQENMVAFRHLSIGAEAGLHGFGVEVALPIQKHFVLKAGYNWAPKGDLFNTDIFLDTRVHHHVGSPDGPYQLQGHDQLVSFQLGPILFCRRSLLYSRCRQERSLYKTER